MSRLFQKAASSTKLPQKYKIYAVHQGTYRGELLLYIQEHLDDYCFICIPTLQNRNIPKDKFEFGIENDILKSVNQALPKRVKKILHKQWEYNINNNK